jgi:hypothetical protein
VIDAPTLANPTRRPRRRSRHAIIGQREAQAIAARLGADLLDARCRIGPIGADGLIEVRTPAC